MERLLFLCHRIPYPPDKGDKIRAWHLLRMLSERYRVSLATFVDEPADLRHRDTLAGVCEETLFIRRSRLSMRVIGLHGLVTGAPLTLACYASPRLRRWVRRRLEAGTTRVVAFSGAMTAFVAGAENRVRVADLVDVDSAKWARYADGSRGPAAWLYRREARRLAVWERRVAADFDAALFVSEAERACFLRQAPGLAERVFALPNGVDTDYFRPDAVAPFDLGPAASVFTGAMDYRPNVEAVTWFARQVLPRVQAAVSDATFTIVGSRPAAEVAALARLPGVTVTGRVADVRPYLAGARVAVAPLHLARGVQNKVLEAMAMACPVIGTPAALEGIDAREGIELRTAADEEAFAEAVVELLRDRDEAARLAAAARERVIARCGWEAAGSRLAALIEGALPAMSGAEGRAREAMS